MVHLLVDVAASLRVRQHSCHLPLSTQASWATRPDVGGYGPSSPSSAVALPVPRVPVGPLAVHFCARAAGYTLREYTTSAQGAR
jgi:hypothetical protein